MIGDEVTETGPERFEGPWKGQGLPFLPCGQQGDMKGF